MEQVDFIAASESIIERLADKLATDPAAQRYVQSARDDNTAGEWQLALETLAWQLHERRIPVTADEARDLTEVLTYLSQSPSLEASTRAQAALDEDVANLTVT